MEFEEEVNEALEHVTASPETYAKAFGDVRRILVNRFSYIIYYGVEPERIVVYAVYHGHRDQDEVKHRI